MLTRSASGIKGQIIETVASIVTSTKQFVNSDSQICEERDASNTVIKKFVSGGQTISGSNYFYFIDQLGSIRDMTDSSGVIQAHYEYDLYGQRTKTVGALDSDFQYAGYYMHAPSGLNLPMFRAYSPSTARWIKRDPIGELESTNLFSYVQNNPINNTDPSGLYATANRNCTHKFGCYGRCCEFFMAGALTPQQYSQCLRDCDRGGFRPCPYAHACSCACYWMYEVMSLITDAEYRGCLQRCRDEHQTCQK